VEAKLKARGTSLREASASAMSTGPGQTARQQPSPLEAEVLELFDSLHDRLVGYLLRFDPLTAEDCEDVVQDAFLALFQHLQKGRSRENLSGWMFRVVHNFALKRLQGSRRSSRKVVAITAAARDPVDSALNPEDAYVRDETQMRLHAVVKALPAQDQRCLALRAEGLRYRDIAEVLGMSLGAVAKSLERSLARIARVAGR